MGKFILLIFFLHLSLGLRTARAQDERYFRQLFSGELTREKGSGDDKKYSYFIHTPYYEMDLNHDKNPEEIIFVKKDSEDWIEIFEKKNGERKKIFSYRFETKGYNSELYRMEFKKLSEVTSILILYYYEGLSKYTEMQSTSRVYAITIDHDDLKSLSGFKGPSFFEEHKSLKGHYHLRNYQVYLQDLNNDNVKELIVKFHLTSQVFLYEGLGKWKTFVN
jgi:hypothetical protein